jgi:CheY-like chemotaxis protein
MQQSYSTEGFRPIAYVALDDLPTRTRVVSILEHAGWTAIVEPTGFHLLRSIADVIDGARSWRQPRLIVIDAFARGCAGTTIALGLRDLGITIPIVLVRGPAQPMPAASSDRLLRVVDPHSVERVVAELARAPFTPTQEMSCGPTSTSQSSSRAA